MSGSRAPCRSIRRWGSWERWNVPLRDYRTDAALIDHRWGRPQITPRIAGAAAVAGGLILMGLVLSLKGESAAVPTDPDTLCPTNRPASLVTVILLDVSDRF